MKTARLGDIGIIIRLTIKNQDSEVEDLSGVTVKQIKLTKPDGVLLTKTASFVTNGTDGKIQYTTIAGDLDLVGNWQVEGYIESSAGKWHTSISTFQVERILS